MTHVTALEEWGQKRKLEMNVAKTIEVIFCLNQEPSRTILICQSFRERDELLVALRATQASQQEAQQKEWATYLRFKVARDKAEEANLGKAEVR